MSSNREKSSGPRQEGKTDVVLLGASNLTIVLPHLVWSLRTNAPGRLTLWIADGHGRSYGVWSRVLFRALPGIVRCRLWDELAEARSRADPHRPSRLLALVTDIGNDLLYGSAPETIAEWVETCLTRLQTHDARIVLTRLPLCSARRLSAWRYNLTKACFFPTSRIGFREMIRRAEQLDALVEQLGASCGAAVVEPKQEWYGFDPIHVRRSRRAEAWSDILSHWRDERSRFVFVRASVLPSLRIWSLPPAERRLLGRLQRRKQPVRSFKGGLCVRRY